jgi:L-malate glycosyltransferase
MRLLYLTRTYTRHDARWLRTLAEPGLVLGFLPLQAVDDTAFAREHPGVELLRSPSLPMGADTRELDGAEPAVRRACAEWQPDVILAGPLTDAGYLATRIQPERTVLMSWAFDVLHEPAVSRPAEERLGQALHRGRYLLADCQAIARECENLAGKQFEQVCVLPWGLSADDKPAPATGLRCELNDQSGKVVLYTRGFEPVHQPQTVIESFRRAYARDNALRLWLAGSGSLRECMGAMVDSAGLQGVVRFLGQLDQARLAGAMAEADAYLACSLSDGSSISLLQAMHAGLPCIAADLPGNREWLEPGGGWLVAAGEPDGFARAIGESVKLSLQARALMAAKNRTRVTLRADLEANLPRLRQFIEIVASEATSAQPSPLPLAV